jgi:hypothetical protein
MSPRRTRKPDNPHNERNPSMPNDDIFAENKLLHFVENDDTETMISSLKAKTAPYSDESLDRHIFHTLVDKYYPESSRDILEDTRGMLFFLLGYNPEAAVATLVYLDNLYTYDQKTK